MRFGFDPRKSKHLRANPRRGIGLEEVQEVFSRTKEEIRLYEENS
jgi:hypothetical protein